MNKFSIIFLMMISVLGFSQTTTSSMSGMISDDTGEPLAGASVVAVHTPTGSKYGSVSQFSGTYAIRNMKVGGPYTITVSYVGFQDQEITGVNLQLGQTFNLDVKMAQAGEVLDAIVIDVKKNSTFSSGRTGAETSIGSKELSSMPSISRSAADFYRLDPSASGGSFGGRNDQFNNFTLDGSIFNNPFGLDAATPGGQTGSSPISIDAIEQIQVSTAPYDVSLSGFTGAAVNAVTKSGTNEFHGTVYGFNRNQDLTGSKVNGEDIFVPELKQLQYGVSVGGPIIKNKLFFFANFEKENRTDAGSNWVPDNGDSTNGINESSVLLSDMELVQDALNSINNYDTGAIQGFTHDSGSTKGIIKLDYNLSDKHKLAFVYNFLNASKDKPAHPSAIAPRGPSYNTLQFENSGYEINNKIQSFLVELNSNLSDKVSNKFQAGYTHFDDFRNPKSSPAPSINIFKGGNNYIVAGHEPFSVHNKLDQKVFQVSDNVNILLDKHNVTLGFNFEKFMFKNSFNLFPYGFDLFGHVNIDDDIYYDFGGNATDYNYIDNTTGAFDPAAFKQFLIDYYGATFANAETTYDSLNAAGAGNDNGWRLAELNVGQLAGYIQDEWSATDNLKVTFGVRLDKPMYFNTSDLIQKYMDTDNGATRDETEEYFNPNSNEMVKLKSTTLPTNKMIVSPRLGFNWDVKGDKTIQVRGGTGVFTGRLPFVWLGNQVSGADDGFLQIVDEDFQWPRVWKSSFGVDHKLKSGIVASFDFSYTKDLVAAHVQNWNYRNPTKKLVGVDDRPIYEASNFINHQPWGAPKDAFVFTNSDQGYAVNTTFKVEKSFDNKLYASLAYNFMEAKSVNSIEAEITGDAFAFNPIAGDANEAVLSHSKYGDRHRVIGVLSKKWEYKEKWATTFSTFFEYAKGGRFSYTYAGNINNDTSGQNNDLIYIPTESELATMNFSAAGQADAWNKYIEQDDYLSENRGGYAERYGALSPWRSKFDIKIMQDYKINDANKIQFSIDILNAGNMLNSKWGVVQAPRSVSPIGVSVDGSGVPTYTFDGSVEETFAYDTSLLSRWQMQFGLRYIF